MSRLGCVMLTALAFVHAQPVEAAAPDREAQVVIFDGPQLGVQVQGMTSELRSFFGAPEGAGLLIAEVVDESAAQVAGLRVGDVIVEVADQPLTQSWELVKAVRDHAGRDLALGVIRDRTRSEIVATIPKARDSWRPLGPGDSPPDLDHPDLSLLITPELRSRHDSLQQQLEDLQNQIQALREDLEDRPSPLP